MSRDLEDVAEEVAGRGERRTRSGPAASEIGSARHLTVADMEDRGWRTDRRQAWGVGEECWPPVDAADFVKRWPGHASGPPSYYPKAGVWAARMEYAWSPSIAAERRAWLEVSFADDLPPAQAVRIFEMKGTGSVVEVEGVSPDGTREVLWRGPAVDDAPEPDVLEVDVSPPRRLSRVRVHVATGEEARDPRMTYLDTVALVATEPVTDEADATKGRYTRRYAIWYGVVSVLLAIGLGIAWLAHSAKDSEQAPSEPAAAAGGEAVATRVRMTPEALENMDVVWASEAVGASSQYGTDGWQPSQATGAPDLWPTMADDRRAWASEEADAGEEWLAVRLSEPTKATNVFVVESFNPGAVVRVEAGEGPDREVLWQGEAAPVTDEQPSILRIDLPQPRVLETLRVVLDSDAVEGWNEIDAVGIVPLR
ncbi:MAG: hypothetical protein ACQEXJ_10700 [Myxococcota bacterium]